MKHIFQEQISIMITKTYLNEERILLVTEYTETENRCKQNALTIQLFLKMLMNFTMECSFQS